ncbi:MAG: hypothetical protein PCFJNLEI_01066 [Verrucomicrobiae bacterium]|nr:hypothetical protein [Verrucomicrobiae bacterium]
MAALQFNPLTILALPVIGFWLVRENHSAPKPLWIWLTLGIALAFGIARNIPIYPFTLVNP